MTGETGGMVGRTDELDQVHSAVRRARAGSGCTVFVIGAAGTGKSRLVKEVGDGAASQGVVVLSGRSAALGRTVPHRALTEALAPLLRQQTGTSLPTAITSGDPLSRLLHPPEPGSVHPSPVVLGEAILHLLHTAAAESGCLLVLEDLHDADAGTLSVIEYLIDNLNSTRIALVATSRPHFCPATDLARSAGRRLVAEVLDLAPLSRRASDALVDQSLPGAAADPDVRERFWNLGRGNPFVIGELARSAGPEGPQSPTDPGERPAGTLGELPVTVVRALLDQLEQIGPACERILLLGALAGDRFPVAVVQQMHDPDSASVLDLLLMAVSAHIVSLEESSGGWCTFTHPLARDVLLARLGPRERVRLAGELVRVVETSWPEVPDSWREMMAGLCEQAGDLAAAVGHLLHVGHRLLAAGAPASACGPIDRALMVDQRCTPTETVAAAIRAHGERGDHASATEIGRQALMDPQRSDTERALLGSQLAALALSADLPDVGSWALEQERRAGTEGAVTLSSEDRLLAHLLDERRGKDGARSRHTLLALVQQAEADGAAKAAVTGWRVAGRMIPEAVEAPAAECYARAARIATAHHLQDDRLGAITEGAIEVAVHTGELSGLLAAAVLANEMPELYEGNRARAELAFHLTVAGDLARAEDLLARCLHEADRVTGPVSRCVSVARAMFHAHSGNTDEVWRHLAQDWVDARPPEAVTLHAAAAIAALVDGDIDRARTAARQASKVRALHPNLLFHWSPDHLDLLLGAFQGDFAGANHKRHPAGPESHVSWNRGLLLSAQAVRLGVEGRSEEATAQGDEAELALSRFPLTQHLVLHLMAGAALPGQWGRPQSWLEHAQVFFEEAGLDRVADACRSTLRHGGGIVRQHRRGREAIPAALRSRGVTVREWDVASLVALSLGNTTIGQRLHISPRTVEKHIASLILKTAQPDRGALVRFLLKATGDQ